MRRTQLDRGCIAVGIVVVAMLAVSPFLRQIGIFVLPEGIADGVVYAGGIAAIVGMIIHLTAGRWVIAISGAEIPAGIATILWLFVLHGVTASMSLVLALLAVCEVLCYGLAVAAVALWCRRSMNGWCRCAPYGVAVFATVSMLFKLIMNMLVETADQANLSLLFEVSAAADACAKILMACVAISPFAMWVFHRLKIFGHAIWSSADIR